MWALGPEQKSQDSDDDEDCGKENKKHVRSSKGKLLCCRSLL